MQISSCYRFPEKFSEKEYKTLSNPDMMHVYHNTLELPGLVKYSGYSHSCVVSFKKR